MQSETDFIFVIFIVVISVGLFIGLWFGILFLISRMSGWSKLHKTYGFPNYIQKPFLVKSNQSIKLGISNFNGIVKLYFHPEGLGMEVMILFRFQHPKILIPWKNIKLKEKSKSVFTWNKFEIGNPLIAKISMNNKILEEIEPYITKEISEDDKWN